MKLKLMNYLTTKKKTKINNIKPANAGFVFVRIFLKGYS